MIPAARRDHEVRAEGRVHARRAGEAGTAAAVAHGVARERGRVAEVEGPVSRERLSGREWDRLEAELKRGPLAHGFSDDQRWTLGRIKTLIGRLFHKGYPIQGVAKLLKRHGWSCQVPVRHAIERDG